MMKLISWNVNGIRSCMEKGLKDYILMQDAFFFAIQETKIQEGQAFLEIEGYYRFMSSAIKKGYSGTLIYAKKQPIAVTYGLENGLYNDEGRVITLEYDEFYLVNAYVPNSREELKRLPYRMEFEDHMREHLNQLSKKKHVIYCGDLNVAHERIDLKNPDTNTLSAGFSIEERTKMTMLLDSGFIDTFRYLYPTHQVFSWWSYRFHAREKNIGWRIDYFLISKSLESKIKDAKIHTLVYGSDHCPIELDLDLNV